MILNKIFSSFIFTETLNFDNKKINNYCLGHLKKEINQTDLLDLNNENIIDLKNTINNKLNVVKDLIGLKKKLKLEINEAWCNNNSPTVTTVPHNHVSSVLSAVYYSKVENNSSPLEFLNPNSMLDYTFKPEFIEDYNDLTSTRWTVNLKENLLVIFPSYLIHYVRAGVDNQRISIAMNSKFCE